MELQTEMFLKLVILGVAHWALAGLALRYLIVRPRVLGGRKGLWVLPILFITCFGPLFYLIIHELLPQPQTQAETQVEYDNWRSY